VLATCYEGGIQRRTDDDGCCLCYFSDLFILLHDFLNARLLNGVTFVEKKTSGKDAFSLTGWISPRSRGKRTTGNFVVLFLFFMMSVIRERYLGVTDAARKARGGGAYQCGQAYKCEWKRG
jgi:hypothetical protein